MTYLELNRRANQVAALLQSRGVGPEARVGLFMDRAPETMAVLLGVIKAGAGYVPLDPAYPRERLLHMMNNAKLSDPYFTRSSRTKRSWKPPVRLKRDMAC